MDNDSLSINNGEKSCNIEVLRINKLISSQTDLKFANLSAKTKFTKRNSIVLELVPLEIKEDIEPIKKTEELPVRKGKKKVVIDDNYKKEKFPKDFVDEVIHKEVDYLA